MLLNTITASFLFTKNRNTFIIRYLHKNNNKIEDIWHAI